MYQIALINSTFQNPKRCAFLNGTVVTFGIPLHISMILFVQRMYNPLAFVSYIPEFFHRNCVAIIITEQVKQDRTDVQSRNVSSYHQLTSAQKYYI